MLIIPLLNIPPLIIAAIPRSGKDDAEALSKLHFELTALLHEAGIYPLTLPSDGTNVE